MMDLTQEPDDTVAAEPPVSERRIALFGTGAALRLSEKLRGFVNAEPAPATTSDALCQRFGFLGFSARTGALGSVRALHLTFDAALTGKTLAAWTRNDGRFVDPMRPAIEPEGLASEAEVEVLRQNHHLALRRALTGMDELILVLDSTVHGRDSAAGLDYPFVPGAEFASALRDKIVPHVPDMDELDADFTLMVQQLQGLRPDLQITLAIAPPQPGSTPTRSQQRQLADLRCMMAEWSSRFDTVRYLPIWEMAQSGEGDGAMWAMATSLLGASPPMAPTATAQMSLTDEPDDAVEAPAETEEERRARKAAKRERKRKRANAAPGTVCEDELLEAFSR